jgi:hypothetical protein
MSILHNPAFYTLCGIAVVTAIDTLGSVASRKFGFPYTRLALLSLFFYILMGFLVSRQFDLGTALRESAGKAQRLSAVGGKVLFIFWFFLYFFIVARETGPPLGSY